MFLIVSKGVRISISNPLLLRAVYRLRIHKHFLRNTNIVQTLFLMGFVEKLSFYFYIYQVSPFTTSVVESVYKREIYE